MASLNCIKKRVMLIFSGSEKGIEYEFHRWKKELLIADKILSVLVFILLAFFSPELLVIFFYFMLYPYLFLTERRSALYHLYISSFIALVWMLIANGQYDYNQEMLKIFGLNALPLFGCALGLFMSYMIYSHWEHKFKSASPMKKMMIYVAIYWPILLSIETIAYHFFNIRNLHTVAYAGLPICNCIHAPRWMQISYLALGPIYFAICGLIGLENPHYKKKKD